MTQIYANNFTTLVLGRRGENLARKVVFDVRDLESLYGTGEVEVIYQRPGDAQPYPLTVQREGTLVTWDVTSTDTEMSDGSGKCELRYYVGEVLAKSKTWQTWVEPAMDTPSETAPPEPEQGWVDQIISVGAAAKASAEAAKADADRAAALAAEVAEKAAQTAQDASDAAKAMEAARTAQRLAEEAQGAAEAARTAAAAAQAAAEQSATDAAGAKQDAETALKSAQDAAAAAAQALADIRALYQGMQTWAQGVIQDVNAAGSAAVQSVQSAGDAQVQRVTDEGTTQTANAKAQANAAEQFASGAAQSAKQAAESAAVYDTVVANVNQLKQDLVEIFDDTKELSNRLWNLEEDIYDITYSKGTPVFKHISNTGALSNNNNKNISFEEPIKVLKWSTVYVDKGYKFQLGLFDLSGKFVKRVEWIYNGVYTFDQDYLVRVEISDINETPLTDFSILEHLHINLVASKSNKVEKKLDEYILSFNTQAKNIIKAMKKDDTKRKTYTVSAPNKYKAWSFVGVTNNKLYCFYNIGNSHEDNNGFDVYMKSSDDGIFWEDKKPVFTKENIRENITGMGNGINGELLFWLRSGAPGNSDTTHELYSFDGNAFTKKASPSFPIVCGHVGNIILNKGNNSLFSFFNTYGSNRTWGYLKSVDGGKTWTQTAIETDISSDECPVEINGFYYSNGRYLAMGRKDTNSGTVAMFQIESSDGGNTWSKAYSSIDDVNGSTPSVILNGEDVYLYYWHRGAGDLRLRHEKFNDIFTHPNAWSLSNFEILTTGARGQDAGNVSTCMYNDVQVATFYSGNSVDTGIYTLLI